MKNHSYWIWSFYHSWNLVYKFASFLVQFWLNEITRIVKFLNFEKMMEDEIFHLKKYTLFQVQNFPLLFDCDILLWNCFKEFGKVVSKMGLHFTPCSKYLMLTLILRYNLSHFVPIILYKNLSRYKEFTISV